MRPLKSDEQQCAQASLVSLAIAELRLLAVAQKSTRLTFSASSLTDAIANDLTDDVYSAPVPAMEW